LKPVGKLGVILEPKLVINLLDFAIVNVSLRSNPSLENLLLDPGRINAKMRAMRKRIGTLDFDTASHCVYHLTVHVVFCTKFRKHILTAERRDFLFDIMRQLAAERNCEITEINGETDHIHFLMRYPPTIVLSDMVGALKSKSSASVLDKFGTLFYGKHERTFWSSGFFLCSVGGATREILKAYIDNQGR
jgi:putative transposase